MHDGWLVGCLIFYDISTLVSYLMPTLFMQIIRSISKNSVLSNNSNSSNEV